MKTWTIGATALALLLAPAGASALTTDGIFEPGTLTPLPPGSSVDGNVDSDDPNEVLDGVVGRFQYVGAPPSQIGGTITINPFFDADDGKPTDFVLNDIGVSYQINDGDVVPISFSQDGNFTVATGGFGGVLVNPADIVSILLSGSTGNEGNDIDVYVEAGIEGDPVSPVIPVPPAIALLASGAVGLFLAGRRRREA